MLTLAEWSEEMSRHCIFLALDPELANQRRRALRFRAKRHAQIATVLRAQLGKDGKHGD